MSYDPVYWKEYQRLHKEELKERNQKLYQKNKDKFKERSKEYYKAHKDDVKYLEMRFHANNMWKFKNRQHIRDYDAKRRVKLKVVKILTETPDLVTVDKPDATPRRPNA